MPGSYGTSAIYYMTFQEILAKPLNQVMNEIQKDEELPTEIELCWFRKIWLLQIIKIGIFLANLHCKVFTAKHSKRINDFLIKLIYLDQIRFISKRRMRYNINYILLLTKIFLKKQQHKRGHYFSWCEKHFWQFGIKIFY